MKKFIKQISDNTYGFIKTNRYFGIVLLLLLIVGIGTLSINWSITDDGKSAEISQHLSDSIMNLNASGFINNLLEPESGRFRPLYWIYLWLTFVFFGSSSFLHHLFHLALFVLSSFVIYQVSSELFGKKIVGVVAGLLFVVDSFSIENWYRLGPQEPMVVMLLLLSFVAYKNFINSRSIKLLISSDILIIAAFLFKETVIAYIGILLFIATISYFTETDRGLVKVQIVNSLLMIITMVGIRFFAMNIYPVSGYASLYLLNITTMTENLKIFINMVFNGYSPLILILLISFIVRFLSLGFKNGVIYAIRKYYWNLFFLVWFLCFLLIQSPWFFAFGRYLQIAFVGLFVFMAAEFSNLATDIKWLIIENTKKLKRLDVFVTLLISKSLLFLLFFVIIAYHLIVDLNYVIWVRGISDFDGSMMASVLKYAKDGRRIFLNADYRDGPLEIYYGINWHIKYIYKIDNFNFDYVSTKPKFEEGDLVLMHGEKPMIEEKDLIAQHGMSKILDKIVTIDVINLFIPSILLKMAPAKIIDFSVEKNKDQNFYSKASYTYEWKIYEK